MPSAEKTYPPSERNLNQRERDKLVKSLINLAEPKAAELAMVGRWPELEPYIELTTMMGELRGNNDLNLSQKAYLRKMIALKSTRLPQPCRDIKAVEFMEEVQSETIQELMQVELLPDDPKDYKRPWNKVLDDLVWFESMLTKIGQ